MTDTTTSVSVTLAPEFVALLRCPNCADRPPLRYEPENSRLTCEKCGRAYPVTDGFPDLRADNETVAPAAVPEKR